MSKKRTYFPPTTEQQRRLLFEIWEETGDRKEACHRARVSEGTYYKWKPRFEADGYAGLKEPMSRAPHTHYQTPPQAEAQVIEMRQKHPDWGKRRIADELAKGNNWVPLVSPNTVKRVLQDAGLWPEAESAAKKGGQKTAPAQRKDQDRR
jgi:transposase